MESSLCCCSNSSPCAFCCSKTLVISSLSWKEEEFCFPFSLLGKVDLDPELRADDNLDSRADDILDSRADDAADPERDITLRTDPERDMTLCGLDLEWVCGVCGDGSGGSSTWGM